MATSSSNNLYGFPQPLSRVFPAPIIAQRSPTTADISYPIGQLWIDEDGDDAYILVDVTAGTATWSVAAAQPGNVDTLTGGSGGAITPSAGNIDLLGTANQITTTGTANTITWSLPAAITAPGSLTTTTTLASGTTLAAGTSFVAGTTITATLGNITATNGNLVLTAAGNKMIRTSVATNGTAGANSIGTATLVGGTVTISTTALGASSLVRVWRESIGSTGAAATGNLVVGTRSTGVSFVINAVQAADATALQASDVSVVGWEIIN